MPDLTSKSAQHRYWGKAYLPGAGQDSYHLLPYHSLDVAAVGLTLLQFDQVLMSRFEATSGLSTQEIENLLPFLLCLHDIGKFSVRFQNLRPDVMSILQPGRECNQGYTIRHDDMGYWLWDQEIMAKLHACQLLPIDSDDLMDARDLLAPLVRAVLGHHGLPPQPNIGSSDCFDSRDREAALSFATSIAEHFSIGNRVLLPVEPFEVRETCHKRLSWILAGLCVLSDWIGSDSRRFSYCSKDMPLEQYWKCVALPSAVEAVNKSGILPPRPRGVVSFPELFPRLAGSEPTPLQAHAANSAPLPGPQLHIFEDATGSGKTEAAIICAQRMMQAGLGEGIFVALPTMATANAMYMRMADVYRNLFVEHSTPSLTLAHGSRNLSQQFLRSIELENMPQGKPPGGESAEATCSAWLADNKKKAMLAATGVGTVDQALLGVLASKHQSLRLLGLGRDVLIVDEVHSYDPYMQGLLCNLLTFQSAQGGSAILLSATLPARVRTALASAFSAGLGRIPPKLAATVYPLATAISREGVHETAVEYGGEPRQVPVELIHDGQRIEEIVAGTASSGGCVLWVRNTVRDALQAYQSLMKSGKLPEADITLFHARFAACDRLLIEDKVLSTFGLGGCAVGRRGKVVIATQVAEQSLDVDFDVLITDLAPIDLVLQRIGRWRRHNRSDRPAGLPGSVYVFSPQLEDNPNARWYRNVFPAAAHVYPFQSQLWLTARLLAAGNGYRVPDDARRLIEGVYGKEAEEIPEALREADIKAEGEAMGMMTMAGINGLSIWQGYGGGAVPWKEDEVSPTRLGETSVRLRLARWDGHNLAPWSEGASPGMDWYMSEVAVPAWRVAGEIVTGDRELDIKMAEAIETMSDKGKWSLLVPLTQTDAGIWKATVCGDNGGTTSIIYSGLFGVGFESS